MPDLGKVGVAADHDGPRRQGREVGAEVPVAVGDEEPLAADHHLGEIAHEGEPQEHLVDLAVAVAADGHDLVGPGIEQGSAAGGIVAFKEAVSRSVVQEVPGEDEQIGSFAFGGGQRLSNRGQAAVEVGEENEGHGHGFTMEVPTPSSDTKGMDMPRIFLNALVYSLPWVAALYLAAGVQLSRKTGVRGFHPFALVMAAAAVYSFGYFLELHAPTLDLMVSVRNFELLGAIFLPTAGFLFVADLLGRRMPASVTALLVAVSLGLWLLLVTNPSHGWFYRRLEVFVGAFTVPVTQKGPGYFAFLAYVGLFLVTSSVLLFRAWRREPRGKRRTSLGMVLATFQVPWAALGLIVAGLDDRVDPVPPAILIVCLLFLVNEVRNDLFERQVRRWRRLFHGLSSPAFLLDPSGTVAANNAAEALTDIDPGRLGPLLHTTGAAEHWYAVTRTVYDPDRKLTSCFLLDITDQKRAEEALRALVQEKELILREVHHRIKNNMGNIMGLFALQAMDLKEPTAVAALEEASGRVQTMMVLYDKLYQTTQYGRLGAREYLSSLIDEILGNFPLYRTITVEKAIDDIELDEKTIQPLGIILNELLTNVMKYAFVGRDGGVIQVSLGRTDGRLHLVVRDNGNGMAAPAEGERRGFGLELVKTLVEHQRGTLRIDRSSGTTVSLEWEG